MMTTHDLPNRAAAAGPFDNALAWVHFQLRGGWTRVWQITSVYVLAVIAGIVLYNARSGRMAEIVPLLLGLQAIMLVIGGAFSVAKSVQQDMNSGTIESHRMMPVAPGAAVTGYIAGSVIPLLPLVIVNFVAGTFVTIFAGMSPAVWFVANGCVLMAAMFLWVVFAAICMRPTGKNGNMIGVLPILFIFFASNAAAIGAVPLLVVLGGPLIRSTIARMNGDVTPGHAITLASLVWIGWIAFRGAMRKYDDTLRPALGVKLGLFLALAVATISGVGIARWELFVEPSWSDRVPPIDKSLITVGLTLLVLLAPLASAARTMVAWLIDVAEEIPDLPRCPRSPLWTALAGTPIAMIPLLAVYMTADGNVHLPLTHVVLCAGVIACVLVQIALLQEWTYAARYKFAMSLWVPAWAAWLLVWFAPMIIEAYQLISANIDVKLGSTSAISPVGLLLYLCRSPKEPIPWTGVAAQLLYLIPPALLWFHARRILRRPRTAG